MTIAAKLQMLAAIKAAQYEAIIAKGGTLTAGDWGAYAAAIAALPSGGNIVVSPIPSIIYTMPFEAGDEPTGGTVWYVKPGGTGDQNGTSWDHAFATRQQAVNAASYGDQIRVWEGTYYLDAVQTPKAGVSEYYGFQDDGAWATRQPFTHPSKHDAGFTANNFNNASYVFLDGQVIDGVWFQNVTTSGGMVLTQKTHLKNCTINNNSKGGVGGGVYAINGSTLTNCVICNNTGTYGGGVLASNGSTLTNCVICNNTGTSGGGVAVSTGSNTIINCVICNNTGTEGGGVAVSTGSNTIINCVICNNTGTSGGGAYLGNGVYNTIINCVICNNTGTSGGGVYSGWNSSYYNVTAINNTAPTGANLYADGNSRIIYNCVSWGGNIYLARANYAYKIYNCASNFALTGVTNWGTVADVQNFLTLTGFPFAAAGVAPFDGSGAYGHAGVAGRSEYALEYLYNTVLPSLTDAHLSTGSPLIGAGYYEAGVTPDTDADGKVRPLTPSIGAYEP